MKKISFKAAILSFFASVIFAACTGSSSDLTIEQNLGYCLTYTKNITNQAEGFNRISFSGEFNYTNYTVDLAVIGIEIPVAGSSTGHQFPKMEFKGLPWKYNKDGWKEIDMSNIKPTITGMSDVPVFKKFNFLLLDVFSGDSYSPGIMYNFDIEVDGGDNKTEANVVGCCLTGKTISKDPEGTTYVPEEDDNVKEKNRPTYRIDFDFDGSKADLYIYNAKFLGIMPSLNMVFPDIPITVSEGAVSLECESLIPEYNGVPYKAFPISQLKGELKFTEGFNLTFHCDFRGTDYEVKFEGKY